MQYTPQPGDMIAPGSMPATELLSRVGGFIAGCGQAALAVLLHAANGLSTDPAEVTQLIEQSVSQHLTVGPKANSGQSTPQTLKTLAAQQGVTVEDIDYRNALSQYAGARDIVIGVNNASVFGGNDVGVGGHYITVVGKTANNNLIVSDPNTSQSIAGQYVVYTPAQIAASNPFWAGVATNTNISGSSGVDRIQAPGVNISLPSLAALPNIGDFFKKLNEWMQPAGLGRIMKIITGATLIFFSFGMFVLGSTIGQGAGDIATAAGAPEIGAAVKLFSPSQAVRSGVAATQGNLRIQREARKSGEKGIQLGVQHQQDVQHQKASTAAKKGAETKRRNKAAAEQAQKDALSQAPTSGLGRAYFGRRGQAGPRAPRMPQQRAQVRQQKERDQQIMARMRQRGETMRDE